MVFKQNTRFIRKASGFLKRGRKNKGDRSSHETSSFAAAAVPHFANTLAVFNVSLEESRVWMPFLPCECISRRKTPCVVQYRQRVQTNLQRTSATPVKGTANWQDVHFSVAVPYLSTYASLLLTLSLVPIVQQAFGLAQQVDDAKRLSRFHPC